MITASGAAPESSATASTASWNDGKIIPRSPAVWISHPSPTLSSLRPSDCSTPQLPPLPSLASKCKRFEALRLQFQPFGIRIRRFSDRQRRRRGLSMLLFAAAAWPSEARTEVSASRALRDRTVRRFPKSPRCPENGLSAPSQAGHYRCERIHAVAMRAEIRYPELFAAPFDLLYQRIHRSEHRERAGQQLFRR